MQNIKFYKQNISLPVQTLQSNMQKTTGVEFTFCNHFADVTKIT